MEAAVRLHNVSVRFGSFDVLRGLSFEVQPGEVFGLLGANGAGKTTTLRLLVKQTSPLQGHVELLGHDIAKAWHKVKAQLGYVPDRANHFEEMTGLQNLLFFAGLYSARQERVRECLRLVDLGEAGNVRVAHYSLGMRRKLLLARALLHQPRLLLLDEPTANLDAEAADHVGALIRAHAGDGGAVMLTTHQLGNLDKLCDRVGILKAGTLQAVDTPAASRVGVAPE